MLLSEEQIQAYYLDYPLRLPGLWTLGRKHLRVMLRDGRFVKLNHFENRLTEKDLKFARYELLDKSRAFPQGYPEALENFLVEGGG